MERIVESRKEYQTWTVYDLTTKSHRSNDCEPKRVFRCRNSTFRVDKKKCVELCFVFWISDVKKKRSRFFQGRLEAVKKNERSVDCGGYVSIVSVTCCDEGVFGECGAASSKIEKN